MGFAHHSHRVRRYVDRPYAVDHAPGHLERELDPHPRRPRHRLAGARRRRRAGHAGNQVHRRRSSRRCRSPRWATRSRTVGFNQWNGVAIASRVGLDDVEVGFDGQPTWSGKPDVEAAAEARALGATCGGVRVWSLYVPNGRTRGRPALRLQAGMACRAAGYRAQAGWPTIRRRRSRWSVTGTSRPPTRTSGDVEFFDGSTHVTGARARGVQRDRRRPIHRRGTAFHAGAGGLHLLGLHPAAVPELISARRSAMWSSLTGTYSSPSPVIRLSLMVRFLCVACLHQTRKPVSSLSMCPRIGDLAGAGKRSGKPPDGVWF